MQFRFLYLDAEGAETKVSTVEELTERVRSGVITEDTVLYDALTREWGPVCVHSAWRLIRDQLDRESVSDLPLSLDPRAATPPATRLTLAPDFLDDEAAVAAFVAARERERREEAQRKGSDLPAPQVVRERSVPEVEEDPAAALPIGGADPTERDGSRDGPGGAGPGIRAGSRSVTSTDSGVPPVAGPTRGTVRRRQRSLLARGGALGAVVAVLLVAWAWTGGRGEADAEGLPAAASTDPTAPPPVDDRQLASVLEEVEGSAFEAMVASLDSLRAVFEVVSPPEGWLGGRYLANASDYARVPAYWERYRGYVDALRDRDDDFFRQGYVARLAQAGLTGPVASIRLARAMEDFAAEAPARDSIYDAMTGVAEAALSLHRLLVERESDIAWTPVRPGFVTRDPILEAVPDDDELRRQLNARLDVLLRQMDVVRGGIPGSGAELGAAALTSLRGTRDGDGGAE